MQKGQSALRSMATLLMIALLLTFALQRHAEANSNMEELQRKVADITLLKGQLGDRQQQAEVHVLMKSLSIRSFQDAQEHLRIRYDIQLLGTIAAYCQAFEAKIRLYQTGRDKLTYLQQLADDDAKMIATLNDFHIDALATQISLVINQYLDEAHTIQIDLEKIEIKSSQTIWEAIVGGKL